MGWTSRWFALNIAIFVVPSSCRRRNLISFSPRFGCSGVGGSEQGRPRPRHHFFAAEAPSLRPLSALPGLIQTSPRPVWSNGRVAAEQGWGWTRRHRRATAGRSGLHQPRAAAGPVRAGPAGEPGPGSGATRWKLTWARHAGSPCDWWKDIVNEPLKFLVNGRLLFFFFPLKKARRKKKKFPHEQ